MHGQVANGSESSRSAFLGVKRLGSLGCPVNERIQDQEMTRRIFLLQGPTGSSSQDVGDAQVLQGQDVGPVVDVRRVVLVFLSMPSNGLQFSNLYYITSRISPFSSKYLAKTAHFTP